MKQTEQLQETIANAMFRCRDYRHEFITPEHFLLAVADQFAFIEALESNSGDDKDLKSKVIDYLDKQERISEAEYKFEMASSKQFYQMLEYAYDLTEKSGAKKIDIPHFVSGIFHLKDSWANYLLTDALNGETAKFMSDLISNYGYEQVNEEEYYEGEDDEDEEEEDEEGRTAFSVKKSTSWLSMVTCINDQIKNHNPLIGRESELERTMQVLCRKEKNNPLHVGESGVGKTSLVYGLAEKIQKEEVPERLKDSKIYQLDMGALLAGTQYRGDMEKRMKQIMDGISKEDNPIVYIDEIHNIVGAGRIGDGSMDASDLLKPYLESGKIRFIGSTTYDEYNRYFSKSVGLVRRFQQIDIPEPSIDETISIIKGLEPRYKEFHQVEYTEDAIDFAVRASAKYINDRFLPDKAIDLVDEAGAYREIHPVKTGKQTVDKVLITDMLAKTCKIDAMAMKEEDNKSLETLYQRINDQIYGQDEAVKQVVEAVQMAKAGLLDDNKPLASLLFVGPTGVGKTEVAKVLAKELGIELIRFDMSEYTEKHTVAKLIGSPAGYVGYEDGGLLTDAIRKTPNCVLLLDEIEKAHSDIYNILLQVMDYARLTDNKGRKADFRNVVLIMTSNAGAQYASMASVGFGAHVSTGENMMKQVKRTFKPEFINRLSGTVIFHDMDKQMATLILNKKLTELQKKLAVKHVSMELSKAAKEQLLELGFTREYGARELDRVISTQLKSLFMKEILFGKLRDGGKVSVDIEGKELKLK